MTYNYNNVTIGVAYHTEYGTWIIGDIIGDTVYFSRVEVNHDFRPFDEYGVSMVTICDWVEWMQIFKPTITYPQFLIKRILKSLEWCE